MNENVLFTFPRNTFFYCAVSGIHEKISFKFHKQEFETINGAWSMPDQAPFVNENSNDLMTMVTKS